MIHYLRIFSLALLVVSTGSHAQEELEAFDFINCSHWSFSVDFLHSRDWMGFESEADRKGFERAESSYEALISHENSDKWSLYIAYDFNHRKAPKRFGACSGSDNGGFVCLPGYDLPISGASFLPMKSQGKLVSLKCVKGCASIAVQIIHDIGYEPEKDERNFEYGNAWRRFRKVCKGK